MLVMSGLLLFYFLASHMYFLAYTQRSCNRETVVFLEHSAEMAGIAGR